MPTTTGMKGGGFYDAHSKEQRSALASFLPWLEDAITDLPAPAPHQESWNILDLGSSEGANAIYAMNRMITALRRHSNLPVLALFDDLPTNDFNQFYSSLFSRGNHTFSEENIFTATIGGSAFGRLVPPRSLHLATTFNTIGFFETKPEAQLPQFILPTQPNSYTSEKGVTVTDSELKPFRDQAHQDLLQFYTARSQELVSGGKLLVQVFGRNESQSTGYGICDVLNDALLDFVEANMLPHSFYEEFLFPAYYRSLEELIAPLQENDRLASAFRIEHAETRNVPVPFNDSLAQTGDRSAWARSYTGFLRAFTEPVIALTIPDHLPQENTIDKIYERVQRLLLDHPERYEFHFISIATLLTRI